MRDLVVPARALLSVSDKRDLLTLARCLADFGVELVSTGGTAQTLRNAGYPVRTIDDLTGFPEVLDGRVKTLHPKVHGGLLGLRERSTHVQAMRSHGIEPIDLVCVNLYPFEETLARGESDPARIIEQIDIGGPAMIRSASKNHASVVVLTDPSQYDACVEQMRANSGGTTLSFRRKLAAAAFLRTARYDAAIASWMEPVSGHDWPDSLVLAMTRVASLRYGENPHQGAALYVAAGKKAAGVAGAQLRHGKPLSYNNLLDASAAWTLVCDMATHVSDSVAAAIIKHTNPCGAAALTGALLHEAFDRAYSGDPRAAYGGILAVSQVMDAETAAGVAAGQKFFEVIIAPGFEAGALKTLADRWPNVRLMEINTEEPVDRLDHRAISGGVLFQMSDEGVAASSTWKHAAGPPPLSSTLRQAETIWIICKHLKSNAIAIGGDGALFGAGAGQMDRVTACRLAVEKAGHRAQGAIAASDAFFPFDDGPRHLIDAGVAMIVHPGGSKRDQDTFQLCEARGVTCMLTGERHFRH